MVLSKIISICLGAALIAVAVLATAQTPPENHLGHHPGQEESAPMAADALVPAEVAAAAAPAAAEGMMENMQEMMREMLAPPPKELYPSLMELPELLPEQRAELQAAAQQRMQTGIALLSEGTGQLSQAASVNDYVAMQEATALMQEALARFASGVATQQVIAEERPPRDIALQWFKQEMNLAPPIVTNPATGLFGASWFHIGIMLTLVSLAVAMLGIYFHRMQRASVLLRALTGMTNPPNAALVSRRNPESNALAPVLKPLTANIPSKKWEGELRVSRILQETPDVKTFRLMSPLGGVLPFSFLPGQFMTVTVPVNGKPVRRSYTIASSPTQHDYIDLTIKHSPGGLVSGHLSDAVREGALLELAGPSGAFVFTGRECKCILLIAGGVGITPMMSVLRYLLDRSWDGEIFLIYGCRAPEDIIFRKELEYLQERYQNLRIVITVAEDAEGKWTGAKGLITKQLVAESVPDLASRYVHLCGPMPMMEATKLILAELGVPAARIKTEAFGPAIGKVERSPQETGPSNVPEKPAGDESASHSVEFSESGKSGVMASGVVVLDVAEELGVDIDYSCRVGTCGQCRVTLVSGEVTMAVEDGLQPGDKENNIILACQAVANGNIVVKA